ncbi:MAG: hypothetical protein PVSMB1_05830 [Gemmatimonadaceae bacterium]
MDRKVWSGPVGVARIVAILSAIWAFVVSAAGLIGVDGYAPEKAALPLGIMLASLGFLAGFQMGQARR